MLTNKILNAITGVLSIVVVPVQLITTFVLGLLVHITFGILLYPLSLIWAAFFLGPLLGLSWLWQHAKILRIPVALLGVPLAVLGDTYTALIPSMGEMDSRISKQILCSTWPFSIQCWNMITKQELPYGNHSETFVNVLYRLSRKVPSWIAYLENIGVFEELEYRNGA